MKTLLYRVMILSLAAASLLFGVGSGEDVTNAAVPGVADSANDKRVAVTDVKATPGQLDEAAPLNADAEEVEAEDAAEDKAPARIVDKAVLPENLKPSPALEEIIKLIQAGVSEEVIMTYVTNSTNFFKVGSDEIVYLNDLGVSTTLVTALIQHDSSPEMAARKSTGTAQPLPAGVALNTPATNVYPGQPGAETTNPPVAVTAPLVPQETAPGAGVVTYEQAPANVSYFYSSLAPYGNWVEVDGYGLCWQPTVSVVNSSWRPYGDCGRWLWSDHGWYWYSDYSWGWAPFHYGRWCTYPRLGWVWVPDTCWGPSWVSWRYNSSYCGWAPLPPGCNYVSGFGLYFGGNLVRGDWDLGLSATIWNFTPRAGFCDRRLRFVDRSHARRLHSETTVINNIVGNNNTIINEGIGRRRIADSTRGEIPTVRVRDGALARSNARRPERLERNNSTLVVTRPQLPKDPAVRPTVVAARVSSEPRRDATVTATKASANRNISAGSLLAARLAEQRPARPIATGSAPAPGIDNRVSSHFNKSEPARPSPAAAPADRKRSEERSPVVRTGPQRPGSAPLILGAETGDNTPNGNGNSARSSARPTPATRASGNPAVNAGTSQQTVSPSIAARQPETGGRENRSSVNSRPAPTQSASAGRQPVQTVPAAPQANNRPTVAPPSNPRPQNAAPAVSRPVERYRSYAEPPGASRSVSQAPQQAARPPISQPSIRMNTPPQIPAARPSFEAPRAPVTVHRSEPVRSAPAPAPAVRSEPARSSAPSSSSSSGRSQAPSNSGGGKSDERGRR